MSILCAITFAKVTSISQILFLVDIGCSDKFRGKQIWILFVCFLSVSLDGGGARCTGWCWFGVIVDGMHLPVDSVGCGENYGSVGSHQESASLVVGSSLTSRRCGVVEPRYPTEEQNDEGGGGVGGGGGVAVPGAGEMSEGAAVGELWWTEKLVGEAQAEHPGELVRTGKQTKTKITLRGMKPGWQ